MLTALPLHLPLAEPSLFEGVSQLLKSAEMQSFGGLVVPDSSGDAFPEGDVMMV